MRAFVLLIAFCALLAAPPAHAQYELAPDGIAARAAFFNYQWPAIKDDFVDDDFTTGLEFEYSRHLNNVLNLGVPLRLANVQLPTDEDGNFNTVGLMSLDAVLQLKFFRERNFLYPYLYAGIGLVAEDFEKFGGAIPLGASLNFRLVRHVYLSTKAEYRIGFDDLRDNVVGAAGLLILLGPGPEEPPVVTDRDADGVPDAQDLCPDVAGLSSFNGCPDADGDGIPDGEDDCPAVAGTIALRGCPDADGDGIGDADDACPNEAGLASNNGCPLRDSDSDGIPDGEDACPNQPGVAALNGCPDRDADGVADQDDQCPDVFGLPSANGCPDSDGDGLFDPDDRCPNTAGPASNGGCPEIREETRATLAAAAQDVEFETGSDRLVPESRNILDQVVEILRDYPDYKLRLSGHTDSTGSSSFNQQLSEKRAKACYDYLISRGIRSSRLSYAGYGETRPIADNRYREGRERNRRVEFDLYLE